MSVPLHRVGKIETGAGSRDTLGRAPVEMLELQVIDSQELGRLTQR
jgi:hypothetical protein